MRSNTAAVNSILVLSLFCLCGLVACDSDKSTSVQDNINTEKAEFNPAESIIPFPNDLLFGTDGTLHLPVANEGNYQDPQVAMNTSWGFATGTSMSTTFSAPIDGSSLNGDTVQVYQVELVTKPGVEVEEVGDDGRLTYGVDYAASVSGFDSETLVITPLKPLRYNSSYMVVLTSGIRNTAGTAYEADLVYSLLKLDQPLVDQEGNSRIAVITDPAAAQRLEPLREATHSNETIVTTLNSGLSREAIILSWTFTTQPAGPVLAQVRGQLADAPLTNINAVKTMDSLGSAASIHVGTLQVPYYLEAPSQGNPIAPLTEYWKNAGGDFLTPGSPVPQKTGDQTVPLLLSIPNGTKPDGGWPVVIFQHGITRSRQDLLGVADALAAAGMAVVAIDLPLHGITDTSDGLRAATEAFNSAVQERSFDLDLANNATLAFTLEGDGTIDNSGTHFINLRNLAVTRDNVRQGVADLFTLTRALHTMNYDGNANNTDFDTSRVYFMGHSLGAIVGSLYLAMETEVQDAVLAMPGASLAKLLDGSADFGPTIAAGLQANGVVKGTADYEAFMLAAQTVIDPADPINYVDRVRNGRGVLLIEVIGDTVIPNTVPAANSPANTIPAPLAGTTPFASLLGLTRYNAGASGSDLGAWMRFSTPDSIGSAHHGSVLTPLNSAGNSDSVALAVFTEMQRELATFLASDGGVLSVTDDTYLVAP